MTKTLQDAFRLIRNYLTIFINSFINKRKVRRYQLAVVFILLIAVAFIAYFAFFGVTLTSMLVEQGSPAAAISLYCLIVIMAFFMTVLMRSVTPSKANDDNLLLALPINKKSIIIAKASYAYLIDSVIMLVMILTLFIVYVVIVPGASVFLIVRGIIIGLLLPLLGNAISSLLGILFYRLSRSFRYFKLIQTFLFIVFTLAFMVGIYYLQYKMMESTMTMRSFGPLDLVVNFVANGNLLSLLIIFLICTIPYAVSIWVRSRYLGKEAKSFKAKTLEVEFPVQSPKISLMKKEISNFFAIPIYVMNTGLGFIFLIIGAIALYFFDASTIQTLLAQAMGTDFSIVPMVILVVGFMLALSSTTAPSISLEGKNFWILRAHPVKYSDVAFAKIMTNVAIGIIPVIFMAFTLTLRIDYHYWWAFMLLPITMLVMAAVSGFFSNLMFPKMTWDTETVPVKQGISVLVSMMFNTVFCILPYILYSILWSNLLALPAFLAIMIGVNVIIIALIGLLIKTVGRRYYEAISE